MLKRVLYLLQINESYSVFMKMYTIQLTQVEVSASLGRVKRETCLASGFLKKRKEEGLFIFNFYFKMAAILFKMSNIYCFFYCPNTHYINEIFWPRHSDKTFRLFQQRFSKNKTQNNFFYTKNVPEKKGQKKRRRPLKRKRAGTSFFFYSALEKITEH